MTATLSSALLGTAACTWTGCSCPVHTDRKRGSGRGGVQRGCACSAAQQTLQGGQSSGAVCWQSLAAASDLRSCPPTRVRAEGQRLMGLVGYCRVFLAWFRIHFDVSLWLLCMNLASAEVRQGLRYMLTLVLLVAWVHLQHTFVETPVEGLGRPQGSAVKTGAPVNRVTHKKRLLNLL